MNAPAPERPGRSARRLAWLATLPVALLAWDMLRAPLPGGHDHPVHAQNALALFFILQHQPSEAVGYLRNLLAHWTPLTYFVTAFLWLLWRGAWAFNAATLLFAAAFLMFFRLLLRRLGARGGAAALAVLAVLANPEWLAVMRAYNLEPALAAAVAFLAWAFVRQAGAATIWESAWLGAASAAAMFAKSPIAAAAILPSVALLAGAIGARENRGARMARRLLFLLLLWTPFLLWHAPRWVEIVDVFRKDSYLVFSNATGPWTFYLRQIAFGYAALPWLAALLLAAPFISWRKLPREAWLVFLAGLGLFLFYAAVGLKRTFYPIGGWALWTALGAVALAHLKNRSWRGRLLGGLVGLYGLLAVLIWFPAMATPVKILSLGSAAVVPGRDPALLQNERIAATQTLAAAGADPLSGVGLIDLAGVLCSDDLEMLLSLARPEFALVRGLHPPLASSLASLERKSLLLTTERADARGPSFDALAAKPGKPAALAEAEAAAAALDRTAGVWTTVSRAPLGEFVLAVYRNASAPRGMTPRDFIERAYLDDLPVYLRETERRCRADANEAERRFALAAATYPQTTEIYEPLRRCLRAAAAPAAEAALMERFLREAPPEPAIFTPILDRLLELENGGWIRGRFVENAALVLTRLAGDEIARYAVAEKLLVYYLERGDDAAAGGLVDEQLAGASPARRRQIRARFAELAFLHGADALAARLYAPAAGDELTAAEAADLPARLSLLAAEPAEPPSTPIADAAAARAAAERLIARSVAYRRQHRPEASLRRLDERAAWLELCGDCRDDLLLEKARACLDAGRTAEAARLLAAVRGGEARRLAAELRAAARRRGP